MKLTSPEQERKRHLPSFEEYKSEVEKISETTLGKFFPFVHGERKRVIMTSLMFFLIGLLYFFLKQFRNVVVYDVFDTAGIGQWLELISFICSYHLITSYTNFSINNGESAGIERFLLISMFLFAFSSISVCFEHKIIPEGWAENLMNGECFSVRHLGILNNVFLLLNHGFIVSFYLIAEVFSVSLYTFVFSTYLNSIASHFQIQRYLFPMYLCSAISMLLSTYLTTMSVFYLEGASTIFSKRVIYTCLIGILSLSYGLMFLLKRYLDKIYSEPLHEITEMPNKRNKAKRLSIGQSFTLIKQSKLLRCLCTMALGYYYCTSTSSAISRFVFYAYSEYLTQNPTANKWPGFIPTKNNLAQFYTEYEYILVSVVTIFLLITPLFRRAFERFGVCLFSTLAILMCVIPTAFSVYFAALNFPFTNHGKLILCSINLKKEAPNFANEAFCTTATTFFSKLAKFVFYDILKENLTCKIDPKSRGVYKGIFDGLVSRMGRFVASLYVILAELVFSSSDMRFLSPLTLVVTCFFCSCWLYAAFHLHKVYTTAVKNEEFMDDSNKQNKS